MESIIVFDKYPKVDLLEFLPELKLEIPELTDDIILNYVRLATIEFAERTKVLTRKVEVPIEPCVDSYLIESPDCTRVFSMGNICGNGCHTITRLTSSPCEFSGCHSNVWWERPNILRFSHPPTQVGSVYVEIYVAPEHDACEVDDILYSRYKESIQAGARSKLFNIPRREWSSQGLSDRWRAEFDRRIASASYDRLSGGQTGSLKMKTLWRKCHDRRLQNY